MLYAEYWVENTSNKVIIHTGKVGYTGNKEVCDLSDFENNEDKLDQFFTDKFQHLGYQEIADKLFWIVIQYPMKSLHGNKRDHWLKEKVSEYLNSELGWKGLGHIDDWDMGRTITQPEKFVLNVYCVVVDEQKAISTIKNCLKEYGFDYTWIKIASRPNIEDSKYQFRYSARKKDQTFSL